MRSFIGWIGGKSHLKNQIISLIPSGCNRYIEVCGGAGWIALDYTAKLNKA